MLQAPAHVHDFRSPSTLSDPHPELDASGLRSPVEPDLNPRRLKRAWVNLRELRNGAKERDVDNESKPAAAGSIALSIEFPIERRTWIGIMDVCFPLGISLAACKRESGSGSSQRAGPLDLRCMGSSRLSRSSLRCSGDFLTWMLRDSIQGLRLLKCTLASELGVVAAKLKRIIVIRNVALFSSFKRFQSGL